MARIAASYSKSAASNGVQFKVVPASSPDAGFSIARLILTGMAASLVFYIIAAVLTPLLLAVGRGLSFIGLIALANFIYVAVFACVYIYIWFKLYKWFSNWILRTDAKVRHAYDVDMLVNTDGISILGTDKFLRREDIHRLVLKNAMDNTVELPMTSVAVAGNALTVGTMAASNAITNGFAAIANAKRRAAAAVSFQVTAEAGGVSHPIAGGLTDVCAYGLMTDIDRTLSSKSP